MSYWLIYPEDEFKGDGLIVTSVQMGEYNILLK